VPDQALLKPDWEHQVKAVIAEQVLIELDGMGDTGLGILRRIAQSVCQMKRFDHLLREDDGAMKVAAARRAGATWVKLGRARDSSTAEEQQAARRRERAAEERNQGSHFQQMRVRLLERFNALIIGPSMQDRGYAFERLLYDLFFLFDLDPKKSFKVE